MPEAARFLPDPVAARASPAAAAGFPRRMTSAALAEAIARYTAAQPGSNPYVTAIPGFTLLRADCTMRPMPHTYKPAMCIVAQGAKSGTFGATQVEYRAGQALIVGIEMPGIGRVIEATPEAPFLGAIVAFDLAMMRDVLAELDAPVEPAREIPGGVMVADLDGPIVDCVLRLVRLLDTPRAIPALVPALMRELSYWLLSGSAGGDVASVVFGVDRAEHVIAAIHAVRERFAETIRVEELAATARMSPSTFHRKFKTMTSMTPLQYQKQMRLLEARNLMLTGGANAEAAAYHVGYESPSQFSREYARMFGAPPRREVADAKALASRPTG